MFENRVLRIIFEPKGNEVTREWRKLHIVKLNDLYSSPNIVQVIKSRIMRWEEQAARIGGRRGVHMWLVGKPEGKRPLGRLKHRWEDNSKMYLQDVECGFMNSIDLTQDRDRCRAPLNAVMNIRVP
jgi:hypothetical protein